MPVMFSTAFNVRAFPLFLDRVRQVSFAYSWILGKVEFIADDDHWYVYVVTTSAAAIVTVTKATTW